MAGRDGARGYVYQALVAVFKCLQFDWWNQIKVEPSTKHDKVDILLKKDEVLVKAIQVKTSVNKFERPDIIRWIEEIKKDVAAVDYELVLVGDHMTKPAREFIQKNNENKNNDVHIEIIEGGQQGIEKLTKSNMLEFLECYNPECSITVKKIDDIADKIFAELMKMSTNERWFSKNDLISIIDKNIISDIDKKKIGYSIKRIISALMCIVIIYLSIYVSKESFVPMMCVIVSDIILVIIWGLLKYSDIHFWRNLEKDSEYYSSEKYGSDCRSIAVHISKDSILYKQKVYIENLLAERIEYIDGVIKFFSGNIERNRILFSKRDIDSGRQVKVDEISYDTDREYCDKTFWDEVELHIHNIASKDSRASIWSGTVIKFYRMYNFDQFNYFRLGEIKILPYEITWFKNEIVLKLWRYIKCLLTVYLGGYDRTSLWKYLKIKVVGLVKRARCRMQGILLIGIISIIVFVCVYGQFYWVLEFFNCLFG